jgi:hypothetical protein
MHLEIPTPRGFASAAPWRKLAVEASPIGMISPEAVPARRKIVNNVASAYFIFRLLTGCACDLSNPTTQMILEELSLEPDDTEEIGQFR